jgi:hypothetical protein
VCSFKSSDSSLPVGWSSAAPSVGSLQLYTVLLSILMVVRVLVSERRMCLQAFCGLLVMKGALSGCVWVLLTRMHSGSGTEALVDWAN